MLNQSNNIVFPSHEQFMAYVNGSMAVEEMKNFKIAIDSDAFLSDALEGYQSNSGFVDSISNKVNTNLQAKFHAPKSGSMKYFLMAGSALTIVILSVFFYNSASQNENESVQNKNLVSNETENIGVNTESENGTPNKGNMIPINDSENNSSTILDENPENLNETILTDDEIIDQTKEDEFDDDLIENVISNKKDSQESKNENNSLQKTARLAVINIQIGLKENPSDSKPTKTKIVNGQIVRVNKSNVRTYNQEDLPTYYGGDDALLAEIRGSVKPATVKLDAKYNRVIGFDFVVNANGKVDAKSLNFIVEPYPEIKKQLIEAILNLPSFNPGKAVGKKGKIKYSILMKF